MRTELEAVNYELGAGGLPLLGGSQRRIPSGLPFGSVGGRLEAVALVGAAAGPPAPPVPPPHVGARKRPTPAPVCRESSCTKNSRRAARSYSWSSCSSTVRGRGPTGAALGVADASADDGACDGGGAGAELVNVDGCGCRTRSRYCQRRSASVPGGSAGALAAAAAAGTGTAVSS